MVKATTSGTCKPVTLLERYEKLKNGHPERFEKMMTDRDVRKQQLFGEIVSDPIADATHELVASREVGKGIVHEEEPPLIQIRLQYVKEVTHSRYQASVLSNIIEQADNVVDMITCDEDDSDYETLVEIENNSGFLGLGLLKDDNAFTEPELRILVVRLCNVDKIPVCGDKIDASVVKFTLKSKENEKEMEGKTARKYVNFKNRIGFCHVFIFRGHEIEKYLEKEITLMAKFYTKSGKDPIGAYVTLSPDACELGDASNNTLNKCTTDMQFWRKYLENATEDIVNVFLPLKLTNPNSERKNDEETTGNAEENDQEKRKVEPKRQSTKKKLKNDLKKLFG